MSEAASPADAPLTVEGAIESLLAPPEQQEDAAPVEAAADEETEADPNPAEDVSEAEEPGDDGETEEPTEAEAQPVDAPQWWDAEAKAKFAALTPDLQAIVLAQEDKREAVTAKAKQEAAEERKAAQAEIAGVKQFAENLAPWLAKAAQSFQEYWGEPDWQAVIDQHGVEGYTKLKLKYDEDRADLQRVAAAKQLADNALAQKQRQDFLTALETDLKGTPLEPAEKRKEVTSYLETQGFAPDDFQSAGARELMLAHKAMLYDKAQAALKAKPPKPATPAPAKAPTRPTAGQPGSSKQRTVAQVGNRFAQTRSIDDAVALLLAKG